MVRVAVLYIKVDIQCSISFSKTLLETSSVSLIVFTVNIHLSMYVIPKANFQPINKLIQPGNELAEVPYINKSSYMVVRHIMYVICVKNQQDDFYMLIFVSFLVSYSIMSLVTLCVSKWYF